MKYKIQYIPKSSCSSIIFHIVNGKYFNSNLAIKRPWETPLEITSYFGFLEIAELLLKHDAKITTACIERASNGWDGNVQTSILKLFDKYE